MNWLPTWVNHGVTKSNYHFHLRNMAREAIRYSYDPPALPATATQAEIQRANNIHRNKFPTLVAAHQEHADRWTRDIDAQYAIAMA